MESVALFVHSLLFVGIFVFRFVTERNIRSLKVEYEDLKEKVLPRENFYIYGGSVIALLLTLLISNITFITIPLLTQSIFPTNVIIRLVLFSCVVIESGCFGVLVWSHHALGVQYNGNLRLLKQNHKLIQTGPYQFVRHPIYGAGCVFIFFNCILLQLSNFVVFKQSMSIFSVISGIAAVVLIVLFVQRVPREEEMLTKHFGKEYQEYKKKVPYSLVYKLW